MTVGKCGNNQENTSLLRCVKVVHANLPRSSFVKSDLHTHVVTKEKKPRQAQGNVLITPFGVAALWSGTNKNRDVSTGPLARPFARGKVN